MSRIKRCHIIRNLLLGIVVCMILDGCVFQKEVVVLAGKTSVRSSLVATGTKIGGSQGTTQNLANSEDIDSDFEGYNSTSGNDTRSPISKLRSKLRVNYDSSIAPVLDYRDSMKVEVDMTYRQVLDLDEKNQILKSLIWYRQYWRDEHLTWDPKDYDGVDEISLPSTSVWRPDIAVYEEVGARDLSPRIPFLKVNYKGDITYAEPTILETTCSVDTAFFPFDSQICSMTFVSWSQPLTKIDLRAQRHTDVVNEDSNLYFIASGEWVLRKFGVQKHIALYYEGEDSDYIENLEVVNNQSKQPTNAFPAGDYKKTIAVPATAITTKQLVGRNLTSEMYSEVRYRLIIRRNSSLYMQSMLFPSILLTSVALLGFYLPPDSGERVGLQITILLTFMVFLLTVGEMFPASTGPYLGIYFVISMAQLGVNIFMTVVVLHLHFKPCVQNRETWVMEHPSGIGYTTQRESVIPVKLRRFLKFCNKYFDLSEEHAAWMKPILDTASMTNLEDLVIKVDCENEEEGSETDTHDHRLSPEDGAPPNNNEFETRRTPEAFVEINKNSLEGNVLPGIVTPEAKDSLSPGAETYKSTSRKSSPNLSGFRKMKLRINGGKSPTASPRRSSDMQKMIDTFRLDVKHIMKNTFERKQKERDTDEEMEEEMEKEQEEWKSVARAVDRLFFRLYVFLMITSHVILAVIAIVETLTVDWDV